MFRTHTKQQVTTCGHDDGNRMGQHFVCLFASFATDKRISLHRHLYRECYPSLLFIGMNLFSEGLLRSATWRGGLRTLLIKYFATLVRHRPPLNFYDLLQIVCKRFVFSSCTRRIAIFLFFFFYSTHSKFPGENWFVFYYRYYFIVNLSATWFGC